MHSSLLNKWGMLTFLVTLGTVRNFVFGVV
jgi:hypothetical protein